MPLVPEVGFCAAHATLQWMQGCSSHRLCGWCSPMRLQDIAVPAVCSCSLSQLPQLKIHINVNNSLWHIARQLAGHMPSTNRCAAQIHPASNSADEGCHPTKTGLSSARRLTTPPPGADQMGKIGAGNHDSGTCMRSTQRETAIGDQTRSQSVAENDHNEWTQQLLSNVGLAFTNHGKMPLECNAKASPLSYKLVIQPKLLNRRQPSVSMRHQRLRFSL